MACLSELAYIKFNPLFSRQQQKTEEIAKQVCGEYWADFPNGAKQPLPFRQACNSAIHAKEIWPHMVSEEEYLGSLPLKGKSGSGHRKILAEFDADKTIGRYDDRITIRGLHKNKITRAQIDIIQFVRIADTLINFFEENDHAN